MRGHDHRHASGTSSGGAAAAPVGKRSLSQSIQRRRAETPAAAPAPSVEATPSTPAADPFWFCEPAPAPAPRAAPGPVQRMRLNDEGNYRPFFGSHDTTDRVGFAAWIDQLRVQGNLALLQNILQSLHCDVLPLEDHEAIAQSVTRRAIDQLQEANHPSPAPHGQAQLANLPRDRWWKLFIEGDKHTHPTDDQNAMRFDTDQSPGYYAAMMRAFDRNVSNTDGHQLGFADYDAMHVDCTRDILRSTDSGGFEPVPHALSSDNIGFPMTHGEFPNPRALAEMFAEGTLGLTPPMQQGLHDDYATHGGVKRGQINDASDVVADRHEAGHRDTTDGRRTEALEMLEPIYDTQGPPGDYSSMLHPTRVDLNTGAQLLQMNIRTNRPESAAQGEVNTLFAEHYQALDDIDGDDTLLDGAIRHQKLASIARLVRALHVGHYFHDANGRLNTMLLLDRLLVDAGFAPVIMQRTDIFGGSCSADELVAAIEVGLQAFQDEVADSHAI